MNNTDVKISPCVRCEILEEQVKELREIINGTVTATGCKWIGFDGNGNVGNVYKDWEINVSSIFSKLIKLAAKHCDSYASDLFYSLKEIDNKLNDGTMQSCTYVFAFRDSGIDHREWWELHKDDDSYYREVWYLDVNTDDDKIEMKLHK